LLLLPAALFPARADAVEVQWVGPNLGNWKTPANWSGGFVPDAMFGEVAAINNHTTVVIDGAPPLPPDIAGLVLGGLSGQSGGLRIENGGSLRCVPAISQDRELLVGFAGEGSVTILGGGELEGTSLHLGGSTASALTLGDSSGLTAQLRINSAALNRTTTVVGPNVDFTIGHTVTFGGASTLVADIRDPVLHSPIKSAGPRGSTACCGRASTASRRHPARSRSSSSPASTATRWPTA
jgi:hypothetical protein